MEMEQVRRSNATFLNKVEELTHDSNEEVSAVAKSFLDLYSENRVDLVPSTRTFSFMCRKMTTGKGTDVFVPFPFEKFRHDEQRQRILLLRVMADVLIIEEPLVGEQRASLEVFKRSLESL